MVKPDIKHNYYADLELPTSASLEDIRKSYRKLALQYHPDRNSGREDEVVPKFQAIQAASEVLCDPTVKDKYDNDRRKAGLFSSYTPRSGTPGNPYAATSAYPPPPRRTQTGAWQRPPPPGPPPPPGSAATGADRFSNFPRPTSKKDAAQDRMNAFRAWQNMNTADKQRPSSYAHPPPQPPPPQTQANRPRPQAGSRADSRMPADDPSRPGAKYKVPPPFDPESADQRSSAWASFRQANAGKPGMPTGNMFNKTPNRQGFNPNAPGSDEKAAPGADRQRYTGGSNDDFLAGHGARGQPYAKESSARPPTSPTSPRNRRPDPNPQRPFRNKAPDDQVPFAEGTRERTPYTRSFYGEQSDFLREGLRRSHSWRDPSKLSPNDGSARARARSSSPHRSNLDQSHQRETFDADGSGSASEADVTGTPEEMEGSIPQSHQRTSSAPNETPAFDRPKKVPTRPSKRFANGPANGAQSDTEQQRPNMYASLSSSSSFNAQEWTSQMFGSDSTSRARRCDAGSKIPAWAVPSSLNPSLRCEKPRSCSRRQPDATEYVTGADPVYIDASQEERAAFLAFQRALTKDYGDVPGNLDMDIFLRLVVMAQLHVSTGDSQLDDILQRILKQFDIASSTTDQMADETLLASRFSYPHNPELYRSAEAKSRSEENINTTFSPDGWTGEFTGEPDYFPPASGTNRREDSPTSRPTPNRNASSQQRSATLDVPTPGGTSEHYSEVPQRPWGSDGGPAEFTRKAAASTGFDEDEWQRQFQDSTWSWPPPPPNPPSPTKGPRKQSQTRKAGKSSTAKNVPEAKVQPPTPEPNETADVHGAEHEARHDGAVSDGDAMDIDDTPPAQQPRTEPDHDNGARTYSVPPSEWRQSQAHNQRAYRKPVGASRKTNRSETHQAASKFNANLDDLRNVEPLASRSIAGEGINVADMKSALPFQSQASETITSDSQVPRDIPIPSTPKAPPEPSRLSLSSWQGYVASFGEYVKEIHKYNTTMLRHFHDREVQTQHQISKGMGWLEATGDTAAGEGFGSYLRGIEEDRRVRAAWEISCENHRTAVLAFEKLRHRVRKLAMGGILVQN